jgi:hypothetical protein
MWQETEHDLVAEELFLAGERVLPGTYRRVGGGREVRLEKEDILPASLDGQVACYKRIKNTWAQISERTPA